MKGSLVYGDTTNDALSWLAREAQRFLRNCPLTQAGTRSARRAATRPARADRADGAGQPPAPGRVAYVVESFPGISQGFLVEELRQLERMGLALHVYTLQPGDRAARPVAEAIRAPLTCVSRLDGRGRTFSGSVREHWRAHARIATRHPLRWAAALRAALSLAWTHRDVDERSGLRPRHPHLEDFLQAGAIAGDLLQRPDVAHLHSHRCDRVATVTWLAARMSGRSYSFTAHASDIHRADANPRDLLERKMGHAAFVATCTHANARTLRARHPRPGEVRTVFHGLDTDWFAPAVVDPSSARLARPLILSVGRLVARKGFDQLLEACARLRDDGVDFQCVIVGEGGSGAEPLRRQIEQRKLRERVCLLGAVTREELRGLYAHAHVFALPCQVTETGDRDGFPDALAEAMAMGVPVVSTDVSAIPEVIEDGVHGLLVAPRDPAALATALDRLLADTALRSRCAAAARERACERFDSRRTSAELHGLFVEQLRRVSPRARTAPESETRH